MDKMEPPDTSNNNGPKNNGYGSVSGVFGGVMPCGIYNAPNRPESDVSAKEAYIPTADEIANASPMWRLMFAPKPDNTPQPSTP